jgi:endonuclease YncB( thermonuclease family)
MSQLFLPELESVDIDKVLAKAEAEINALNTNPLQVNTIQDGDTINNSRLAGFDTPESLDSKKTQRIAEMYGVDPSTQQYLGLQAKDELTRLLKDQEMNQFTQTGSDMYGRGILENTKLTDTMIQNGYAVPYDKYDEKRQNLYRRAMEKETNLFGSNREDMQAIRQYNVDDQDPGYLSRLSESVDAFQSGTVQAIGKFGDFVTDVIGYGADAVGAEKLGAWLDNTFETMASTEYADKVTGYDRSEANFAMGEALHQWKMGDYVGALTTAITTPEVVAESLPLMIEMMIGGGKFKAGTKGVKLLGSHLKKNAGLAAVIGQETNAQAEEFEEIHGEKVSATKLAEMTVMNTVMFSLDRLTFKQITGLKEGFKEAIKVLPDSSKAVIAKKALALTYNTGSAMVKEGAQEYAQTWGEILNIQDTDLEGYVSQLDKEELQDEALTGAIMGAGAGGQMHIAGNAMVNTYKAGLTKADTAVKNAQAKVEAEDAMAAEPAEPEIEESYEPIQTLAKYRETDYDSLDPEQQKDFRNDLRQELVKAMTYIETVDTKDPEQKQYYEDVTKIINKEFERNEQRSTVSQAQKESIAKDDKDTVDEVFGSMHVTWAVPEDTAKQLLKSKHLDQDQKISVQNYIDRLAIYKTMDEVGKEVMDGKESKLGLNTYLFLAKEASNYSNGSDKVTQITDKFNYFYNQRQQKAKGLVDAYEKSKQTGEVVKYRGGKEKGGLDIWFNPNGRDSRLLVQRAQQEAQYAEKIAEELVHLSNVKPTPTATSTSTDSSTSELASEVESEKVDVESNTEPTSNDIPLDDKVEGETIIEASTPVSEELTIDPNTYDPTRGLGKAFEKVKNKFPEESIEKLEKYIPEVQKLLDAKEDIWDPKHKALLKKVKPLLDTLNKPGYTPLTSLGKKSLTNTVTNDNFGLNANNDFEPKKSKQSVFDEHDNVLSDKEVFESTVGSHENTNLRSLAKSFGRYKKRFNKAVASLHGGSQGTFIGRALDNTHGASKHPKSKEVIEKNPISLFMKVDEKGNRSYDDNFIAAMMLNGYSWLAENKLDLLGKDKANINRFFSRDSDSPVSQIEYELLADKGITRQLAIKSLGSQIYKSLGLKLKKDISAVKEERLINDLGATALRILEESNILIEQELNAQEKELLYNKPQTEKTTKFVKLVTVQDIYGKTIPTADIQKMITYFKENSKDINALFGLESQKTGPSKTKPKKVVENVSKSTLKVPEKNRKTIKKMQETPWIKRDKNMKVFNLLPKETMLRIGGYVEDITQLHESRVKSVEGLNREIEKAYDDLTEFDNNFYEGEYFYFPYEFWLNGRYGMKSNTVNPQSKKLHRHMVGIASHEITIEPNSKELEQFKLAVAMAFDGDVDKKRKQTSLNYFDQLVQDEKVQQAIQALDNVLNKKSSQEDLDVIEEIVAKYKEKYHTLDGLIALHEYATKGEYGKKAFDTGLAMETDAVTSGFILTLLQAPVINNVMKWLKKGGIYKGTSYKEFGAWAEEDGNLDSYQTLAFIVAGKLKEIYKEQPKLLPLENIMGSMVNPDGSVTPAGRKLMKSPFMTFIYGSSLDNIVKDLSEEALDSVYKKMEKGEDLEALQKDLHALGLNVDIINNPLKRFSIKQEEYLKSLILETYGESVQVALESEFASLIDYRKQTNKMFGLMFKAFDIKFKQAVNVKQNELGRSLTRVEYDEITESLHSIFPGVRPVFSKSDDEKVSVISREKQYDPNDSERTTVSQFTQSIPGYNGGTTLGQQVTSHTYQYVYEASMTAGPVVTIHYIDGSIITSPLSKYEALGVHDAVNHSLENVVAGTKDYNKSTLQVSANYNVAKEIFNSVNNAIKVLTPQELQTIEKQQPTRKKKKVTVSQQLREYYDLVREITNNRREIFNGTIQIAHASHPDTMVEYNFHTKKFSDITPEPGSLNYDLLLKVQRDWMISQDEKLKKGEKLHPRTQKKYDHIVAVLQGKVQDDKVISKRKVKEKAKQEEEENFAREKELIEHDLSFIVDDLRNEGAPQDIMYSSNGRTLNLDSFNAIFEQTVEADNVMNIFNELEGYENKSINPEYKDHLTNMLSSLVQKAMKPAGDALLKLSNDQKYNLGASKGKEVYINVSKTKPNTVVEQSVQETYVHELLHHVLKYGLDKDYMKKTEIVKLFKLAKKHVTYENFLHKDKDGKVEYLVNEKEEIAAAKELYNYVFNNASKSGVNYLHEFVVYGLSNAQLVAKLKTIEVLETRDTKAGNVLERLKNFLLNALDRIISKINHINGKNSYEALYDLSMQIAGVNKERVTLFKRMADPVYKNMVNLNSYVQSKIEDVSDKVFKYTTKNPKNVFTKSLKAIRSIPTITDNPRVMLAMRKTFRKLGFVEDGFFGQLFKEVIGDRDKHGSWYALLRQSKKLIDQARQHEATRISKQINENFTQPLTDKERIALNTILIETDLDVLIGDHSIEDIIEMLWEDDTTKIDGAIRKLETELKKSSDYRYYQTRAEGLGYYMANSSTYLSLLPMNAYNIATMQGLSTTPAGDPKIFEPIIDKLSTLYALKYGPKRARHLTAEVIQREYKANPAENGVAFILASYRKFKKDSLEKLFKGKKNLMVKGYSKEVFDQDLFIKTAPLSQREELEKQGFTYVRSLPSYSSVKGAPTMAIYSSQDGLVTPWMKSIVSTTDRHSKGTTLKSIYEDGSETSKLEATLAINKMIKASTQKAELEAKGAKIDRYEEHPIPLFDEYGNIVDYRYTMSKFQKTNLLGRDSRVDVVMGRMFGSLIDKVESKNINTKVLDMLEEDYTKNYSQDPSAFILLDHKHPQYKEVFDVLPADMKHNLESKFGINAIPVRRELIDLVFGYRKFTLSGLKFLEDRHQLKRMVKHIEKIWEEFIKVVKVTIVMKTPAVLIDNIISNTIASLYHGIPINYIFKKQREALVALKEYKEADELIQKYKHRRASGLSYDATKLKQLEENQRKNPVRHLIDEGVFQSIVEDVDTKNFEYKSKSARLVRDTAEGLVGETAMEIGKQAYMTEDTKAFQFMLKATQYSDFIARYAMYHHMVDHEGKSDKEAIETVVETFIDYDAPTNKYLLWMNDMGLVMFTKFWLRIQRVIWRLLKEKPSYVIAGMGVQSVVGDASDPMDSGMIDTSLSNKFALDPVEYMEQVMTPSVPEILYDLFK